MAANVDKMTATEFAKVYDQAAKEGLGLAEFIERHHPNQPELKELKPKTEMPYKGYFPAGKICRTFRKEFKAWYQKINRYEKHQKAIDLIVLRLNRTQGIVSFFRGSDSLPHEN